MITPSQPRPLAVWLAHHELHLYVLYTLALCALLFWPHNLYVVAMYTPALAGVWAATIGGIRHDTILCQRCAVFPADGADRAAVSTGTLWYFHYRRKVRVTVLIVAALLAGVAVSWWWHWVLLPIWCALCVDVATTHIHRRLALWCPWCRDGGGDGIDVVAPVPTTGNVRFDGRCNGEASP